MKMNGLLALAWVCSQLAYISWEVTLFVVWLRCLFCLSSLGYVFAPAVLRIPRRVAQPQLFYPTIPTLVSSGLSRLGEDDSPLLTNVYKCKVLSDGTALVGLFLNHLGQVEPACLIYSW